MSDRDFGAKVPVEEYERFRALFPMYGATTWFINTALKRFNDLMEESPSLHDKVDKAVSSMVETNRVKSELDRTIARMEQERSGERVQAPDE